MVNKKKMNQLSDVYKVRLISFGWGVVSLILIAIAGVLVSSDFSLLVKTHFGDSVLTGFFLLFIPELAKHFRNLAELKKLGAKDEKVLLI